MAEHEDKDSKSEEPTEKKIRDAVERGQTPVSKELSLLMGLTGLAAYFALFSQNGILQAATALSAVMDKANTIPLHSSRDAVDVMHTVISSVGAVFVPLFLILIVAGLVASFVQNQPAMVLERITPKMNRISLLAGWKRIFGAQGFAEFLKSLGKLLIAGGVVAVAMNSLPQTLLEGMFQQAPVFGHITWSVALKLVLTVCVAMIVIAGADLIWTRFHWRTNLRMTRQEVKDELKQSEGDPIVRARVRSVARDRARRRMMKEVESATLVIANPTHYSVALRYERTRDAAPVVVAKGQDLVALRIREIAEANGVAVFEDVALARSLFKAVQIDQAIPQVYFAAVAELIRVVYAQTSNLNR